MTHSDAPTIREAQSGDLRQLLDIERLSFPDPWSAAALGTELTEESSLLLVADISEEQFELAGYAVTRVVQPEAELLRLAVRPDRQRLGIGSALMRRTIKQLADSGVSVCFLEARADNHAALALYRHFNATPRAVRSSYYRDGHDALILSIEIPDQEA